MRTFRKSAGTLCTAPAEIAFLVIEFILQSFGKHQREVDIFLDQTMTRPENPSIREDRLSGVGPVQSERKLAGGVFQTGLAKRTTPAAILLPKLPKDG
jgi:hypothetical protein